MAQLLTSPQKGVTVNQTSPSVTFGANQSSTKTLDERIQEALEEARAITDAKGVESRESAVAWDIVEELLSGASCRRKKEPKTAFERYCLEYPDSSEARMYDV